MRSASRCPTSWLPRTCSRRLTWRASRCMRRTAVRMTCSSSAAARARSTPSPMRRSSTSSSSARARRRCPSACRPSAACAQKGRAVPTSCAPSRAWTATTCPACTAGAMRSRRSKLAAGSSLSRRVFPRISRSACSRGSRKARAGNRASCRSPRWCRTASTWRCCAGAPAAAGSARRA